MSDPTEDDSIETRLARLEAERAPAKPAASVVDRAFKYLPIFAVSNLLVSAPAFLISIGVAYFTFVQAEATEKMQIASVWPHVTYGSGNRSDDGEPMMTLSLGNQGVGPAKIEGMQVSYKGTAFAGPHELVRACCVADGGEIKLVTSASNGEVMRPGEDIDFVRFKPEDVPAGAFAAFDSERANIRVKVCYCSVFDDCWVTDDSRSLKPEPVEQCPSDWVQYGFPQPAPQSRAARP